VTNFFQVVVLSAYPKAFLRIGDPPGRRCPVSKKIVFELVHPRIGEHQGWIVLYHQWGGRNDQVFFGFEKVQIGLTDLGCGHAYLFVNGPQR
jgi:hypothetical protein